MSGHIVVVGAMASGKTAVGRALARRLGLPFRDLDEVLEARHGSIKAMFVAHGEAHFREIEHEVLLSALAGEDAVLAGGGGVVLDPRNREALADHVVVRLSISPQTAARRLAGDAARPLLAGADPMTAWTAIAAQREPLYSGVATLSIDANQGSPDEIATAIVEALPHRTPSRRTP